MQIVDDASQLIDNILYYFNLSAHIEVSSNSSLEVISKNKGATIKLVNLIENSMN